MKKFILCLAILVISVNAFSQVLTNQKGVSLSWNYTYQNTITQNGQEYDQYLITGYFQNNSGRTIQMAETPYLNHWTYEVKIGVSGVNKQTDFRLGNGIIPNNSNITSSYYMLVPSGNGVPEPEWRMGGFSFL